MSILSKLTWQTLRRNRIRSVVTAIGVALSAALITAVTCGISSLQDYLIRAEAAESGGWHLLFTGVEAETARDIAADSGAKQTAVVGILPTMTTTVNEDYTAAIILTQLPETDETTLETLPLRIKTGRLPVNRGEILMGDTIPLKNGSLLMTRYALGETLTFTGESGPQSYTVVGIGSAPAGVGYIVADGQKPERLDVYVTLKNPSRSTAFAEKWGQRNEINQVSNVESNIVLLRMYGFADRTEDSVFHLTLFMAGYTLTVLVLFGSVLLIYNMFCISINQRVRQFGVLASVGATRKQLRTLVLYEGFYISLLGIPLGMLGGLGLLAAGLKVADRLFSETGFTTVPVVLHPSLLGLAIAAVLGFTTILFSAWLSAYVAAGRTPMENIRQTEEIKIKTRRIRTFPLTRKLFGIEGVLAHKNFKGNIRGYVATILSLIFSIVLFISAGSFGLYLQQAAEMAQSDTKYDIYLQIHGLDAIDLYQNTLKNAPGVVESGYRVARSFQIELPESVLTPEYLEALQQANLTEEYGSAILLDDESYSGYLSQWGLDAERYDGQHEIFPVLGRYDHFDRQWQTITPVQMFRDGISDFEVTLIRETHPLLPQEETPTSRTVTVTPIQWPAPQEYTGFVLLAPFSALEWFDSLCGTGELSDAEELSGTETVEFFFNEEKPLAAFKALEERLLAEGIRDYYMVDMGKEREETRRLVFAINLFTYGFVGFLSLIALANLFNTLTTNIRLRGREFAMLQSAGLTDRGLIKMLVYECLLYGVHALLWGLPLSVLVNRVLCESTVIWSGVDFALPWDNIVISVLGVFVMVFCTMLYAVKTAKKRSVTESLREDAI